MSSQSNRFKFRQAQPSDSEQLLAIMEEEPSGGQIELMYTRRPSPFHSFMQESPETIIIVCEDNQKKCIIGFGGIAFHQLFVNGKPQQVGYLFGLRMLAAYRKNHFILHHAYDEMYKFVKSNPVQLIYTTILSENTPAQKLLGKNRKLMPVYHPWGEYHIFAFKTMRLKNRQMKYKLSETSLDDNQFKEFLNREGSQRQFFPVISNQDSALNIPGNIQFYVLKNNKDGIIAGCGIWNQQSYKQYIVKAYHGLLKALYPIAVRLGMAGFPQLPRIGSTLNFSIVSFWLVKDNNPNYLTALLKSISPALSEFPFFLVGIHSSDPMIKILKMRRHITYKSKIYLVDWDHASEPVSKLNKSLLPYLECGYL